VTPDELEQRIAEFTQWQYRFEFDDGVTTSVPDGRLINRQEQRRRYFFDALLRLYGGSLRGHRVLDLGCSAGFWSLAAIEAGADFVLGIDARGTPIEQARLVFEAKGIDPARYGFEERDIFEREPSGSFDIVLCLSLMNHLANPVELFELMAGTGAETIVVETELSRSLGSSFALSSSADGRKAVKHEIVLIPSRDAVVELADDFGYRTVPLALNMTDYTGLNDYRRQRRLAFMCSKSKPLEMLPVQERSLAPWWLSGLDPRRALQQLRGPVG
jgi:2-polyprenyl-3-methyl-5-hydroxy-6-metoxy-1,4-benzoquinol methylase